MYCAVVGHYTKFIAHERRRGEDDLQVNDKESNAIKSSEIAYTKSLCGELSARPKTLGGQEKPT